MSDDASLLGAVLAVSFEIAPSSVLSMKMWLGAANAVPSKLFATKPTGSFSYHGCVSHLIGGRAGHRGRTGECQLGRKAQCEIQDILSLQIIRACCAKVETGFAHTTYDKTKRVRAVLIQTKRKSLKACVQAGARKT